MICEGCKFAWWNMTPSGRKSPAGTGKCSWKREFRIAGSARYDISDKSGAPIRVEGGYICRKRGDEYPLECDVYQPEKQK